MAQTIKELEAKIATINAEIETWGQYVTDCDVCGEISYVYCDPDGGKVCWDCLVGHLYRKIEEIRAEERIANALVDNFYNNPFAGAFATA